MKSLQSKNQLRQALLTKMANEGISCACHADVIRHITRIISHMSNVRVGGFIPLAGEPDVLPFLAKLSDSDGGMGLRVGFPAMCGSDMAFLACNPSEINGYDRYHCLTQKGLDGFNPDVLLVPMVGFTLAGYRLGRGKGMYDRYLTAHPHVKSIGVGFSWQLVDFQPEAHDTPLSTIVTEKTVMSFSG